ncbi:primase-helicase zinc-binding domain-containing protein [Kluyvera ascorbata]|uniref:Primase-helicase zinc-binding domain-containing protein n=1 Tax=Kluyvera ascorbata TaxID=51288 RepID=A0AB35XA60_9ENTR
MSIIAEIQTAASGKWPAVLRALGVDVPEKQAHIPCPVCGGKDRFHFKHDDVGSSYCRGCNKWRDGLQLARDCGHDIRDIAHCAGVELKRQQHRNAARLPAATQTLLRAKEMVSRRQETIRQRERETAEIRAERETWIYLVMNASDKELCELLLLSLTEADAKKMMTTGRAAIIRFLLA